MKRIKKHTHKDPIKRLNDNRAKQKTRIYLVSYIYIYIDIDLYMVHVGGIPIQIIINNNRRTAMPANSQKLLIHPV